MSRDTDDCFSLSGCGRWSAQTAYLLLEYQIAAYEALVRTMREGAPLGDCIRAIEDNLVPAPSPIEHPPAVAVAKKQRTELSAEEKAERSKAQLDQISKREKDIADRLKEIDGLLGDEK